MARDLEHGAIAGADSTPGAGRDEVARRPALTHDFAGRCVARARAALRERAGCCAIAIALTLSACATQSPPTGAEIRDQTLGRIELDQPWRAAAATDDAAAADAPAAAAAQIEWLRSFDDPTLNDLVGEVLVNNPDLHVAAARLEQAQQHLAIAEAAMRPMVSIFGTGGGKTSGAGDATSALQALVLTASWELDLWGRVRYARDAARQTYASAQAEFEFARQSLAAATARAWFAATQLSLHAAMAAEMRTAGQQLQSLAEARERIGAGTDTETALARASARNLEDVLRQIELARGEALRALELLAGRYPAAEVSARPELVAMPAAVPAGIPLRTLEHRPDVVAAQRRVAAAFNRVGEANAARWPQISLNLSFGAFESEILQLKEDHENPTGGLGVRLLAPLYEGGAITARVRLRTAEQKEAVANYERIALRAIGEVESSLAASATLAARVSLLSEALSEQSRALDLTQTRLRIGLVDRRAFEQQRLNVLSARVALLHVRSEQLIERVNLLLALGGKLVPPSPGGETSP